MRLENRVVFITGGGRGIGREIALSVAREGADVAVNDIEAAWAAAVAKEIEAMGRRSLAVPGDVTNKAEVERMVQQVVEHFGRIDIFFNNAGIIQATPFLDLSEEEWDRTMAVNAKGVFLCGQAVARQMIKQGKGKIINTSSIASRIGNAYMSAYNASKAAVSSLTKSMALALAPHGITVNALAPGIISTTMWDFLDSRLAQFQNLPPGEPRKRRVQQVPLGREGTPADVARVAVFLASDDADYINGQTINICGGTVMS
ncbi:MAG: glucose 1-dehydrogenase [Nitrospinota bacterium]|nr:MAG: glucose 1-dehydrogenase [Nitrospinota bacterium]